MQLTCRRPLSLSLSYIHSIVKLLTYPHPNEMFSEFLILSQSSTPPPSPKFLYLKGAPICTLHSNALTTILQWKHHQLSFFIQV